MAREEKRFELRPVDDHVEPEAPVVRLKSTATSQRAEPVRLDVLPEPANISKRLETTTRSFSDATKVELYQTTRGLVLGISAVCQPASLPF